MPLRDLSVFWDFNGTRVLLVERFDRRWTPDHKALLRLPQEDICQATGTSPLIKKEIARFFSDVTAVLAAVCARWSRQELQHPFGAARRVFDDAAV